MTVSRTTQRSTGEWGGGEELASRHPRYDDCDDEWDRRDVLGVRTEGATVMVIDTLSC